MRLAEYLKGKDRGEMARLARESGVSYATVHGCAGGELLKMYDHAKRLSDATGGLVSVAELCEAPVADDATSGDVNSAERNGDAA